MKFYTENKIMGQTQSGKPVTRPVIILQPGDVRENDTLFASLSSKDAPRFVCLRFGQRVRFHPVIKVIQMDYEI